MDDKPTCCEIGREYELREGPEVDANGASERLWAWRDVGLRGARHCHGCGTPLPGVVDERMNLLRERLEQMASRDRSRTGLWSSGARWSAREIIKLIDHLEGKPNG